MSTSRIYKLVLILILGSLSHTAFSQYFGKNKPRYRSFDFKVYETEHFEIYHYLKNKDMLNIVSSQSELWYDHISGIVKDTFLTRNPIIFFNTHSDFQQTNTISGAIGVGTGGVTEAMKNRVTMPLTLSNQKTFQVLGHELVHQFQFNIILNGDSTSLRSLANLPLYIVEGMAEYITRGRVDPFTAMWMRDIVINDKIPEVKDLPNPKYFPYRYGQAFWSILTGLYGDEVISPFFRETAKYGVELAADRVLHMNLENLNVIWENGLKTHYAEILGEEPKENFFGRKLLDDENAGQINVSPAVSPNGKYLIFLSEKGLFSTDLYLADVAKGKIIRKIASTLKDGDIDNLDAFESAGAWSPDSKKFAYVAFSKGRNKLIIKDVESAKRIEEYFLEGIESISNPSWSPDGKTLVFAGLKEGQGDLFQFDWKRNKLKQLTDDGHADIQPSWSPDGTKLVFSTDRLSQSQRTQAGKWTYNLAELDLASGEVTNLDLFLGADNLNAAYDENGNIWFLSDRDGYRNIYKFMPAEDELLQMTDILTGVSGITPYSPALSISSKRDRIVFTHYYDGMYTIYSARDKTFLHKPVRRDSIDFTAGTLPISIENPQPDLVNTGLEQLEYKPAPDLATFTEESYNPRFKLDYISGSAGGGIGTSSFGTGVGVAGGINMLFSDMLGDNQLHTAFALNGEIYDFAGMLTYINRKNRVNWGVSLNHIPYRSALPFFPYEDKLNLDGSPRDVAVFGFDLVRVFEDQLSVFGILPFNTSLRLEAGLGTTYRFYRVDRYQDYYLDNDPTAGVILPSFYLGSDREKIDIDDIDNVNFGVSSEFIHNIGAAFVGDNSYFGLTAPLAGYRFRIGGNKYFGGFDFYSLTADGRKYIFVKPFSFAFRVLHYARLGKDADSFYPIYIGQQGLVRGFDFIGSTQELEQDYQLGVNQLTGSKVLLTNFEIRIPFSGPERLALLPSRFFFSDLNLFFDGGAAFNDYEDINFNVDDPFEEASAFVMSAGVSLRVNLFGLIVEPYYAKPLRKSADPGFGINFLIPGW